MAGESRTQDNVDKTKTVLDIPGRLIPYPKVKTFDDDFRLLAQNFCWEAVLLVQ